MHWNEDAWKSRDGTSLTVPVMDPKLKSSNRALSHVVVLNGYSRRNTGDWMLFEEAVAIARKEHPDSLVVGIALDPVSFHGCTSADEVIGCSVRPGHVLGGTLMVLTSILTGGRLADPASKAIRRANAAYSVGGGFVQFRSARELVTVTLVHGTQWVLARRCGVRVTMLPQSIGPFEGRLARALGRYLLSWFELIRVRDEASAKHLTSLAPRFSNRVRFTPDLVFARRRPNALSKARREGSVGVVVRNWWFPGAPAPEKSEVRYLQEIAGAVGALMASGKRVELIIHSDGPTTRGDDRISTERILGFLGKSVPVISLSTCSSPEAARNVYAKYELVIAVRMHAALIALQTGAAAIAIAYEAKATEIFGQLGVSEWSLPIESFSTEELLRLTQLQFPHRQVTDNWNRLSQQLANENWSAT